MQINNIPSSVNNQTAQQGGAHEQLPSLRDGDSIKGNVVDVKGRTVTLELENGVKVKARLDAQTTVAPGDQLQLTASRGEHGQLALRLELLNGQDTQPRTSQLISLLLNSDLPLTSRHVEAAQLIQSMGLPITADALQAFVEAMAHMPDAPILETAFLAAQSVPITRENIAALTAMLQGGPADASEALTLMQAALDSMQASGPVAQESSAAGRAPSQEALMQAFTQQLSPTTADALTQSNALNGPIADSFTQFVQTGQFPAEQFLQALPSTLTPEQRSDALAALTNALNSIEPHQPKDGQQQTSGAQPIRAEANVTPGKSVPVFQEAAELPAQSRAALDVAEHHVLNPARSFARLLRGDPDNVAKLQQVADDFPRLMRSVSDLPRHEATAAMARAIDSAATLFDQSRIGSQLTHFIYAQLPFTYQQQENSAGLYVMRRGGKGRQIDPDNVTLLLSVDTGTIGLVDSVVRIEQSSMNVQFRVETKNAQNKLREGIPVLRELLSGTRYKLSGVRVDITDEKLTPVNAAVLAAEPGSKPASGIDISV